MHDKTKYVRMDVSKLFLGCIVIILLVDISTLKAQDSAKGDSTALEATMALIDHMGGKDVWSQLSQIKFQHRWYPVNRESYLEDEVIDLTNIRSWVRMKNDSYERVRAYSPEYGYWSWTNGNLVQNNEASWESAKARGPFNIYRFLRELSLGNTRYELKMGDSDIPTAKKIEIHFDGVYGGSITVNYDFEPLVWETMDYTYTFGPMESYGNIRHPKWAIYNKGSFRYEIITVKGSKKATEMTLYKLPDEYIDGE